MYKEPHPADLKSICPRCHHKYYLCEGCPCWELSDKAREKLIKDGIPNLKKPLDCESDEAQFYWEAWRRSIIGTGD